MSDIESHIATIGRALWARDGRGTGAGRATVMIGAGFSKNAVPQAGNPRSVPTWKDLAKYLIDEILPGCEGCDCLDIQTKRGTNRTGCNSRDRRQKLMNDASGTSGMMELGQKFEAMKGPALLQGVLRRAVPDLEYDPGKAHQDLVRLPWADILTTNWDTLLERAIDTYDRSYEFVVHPKQLATATAPRIVKLHGCVKSGTNMIFTEEDFRTYPQEYAPFVSLVQQSLMENVFVLIGFSGSDPNFKAWHGWVRDHLVKYMQPVYLVTDKSPDPTDLFLFSNRLITVVDLSTMNDAPTDYQAKLQRFFSRLRDYRLKGRDNLDWPGRAIGSNEKAYAETLEDWEKRLSNRPLWIVPPKVNRSELLQRLDAAIDSAHAPESSRITPRLALEAFFEDHRNHKRMHSSRIDENFEFTNRERSALVIAEALKICLARPSKQLLIVMRSIFVDMFTDLISLPEAAADSLPPLSQLGRSYEGLLKYLPATDYKEKDVKLAADILYRVSARPKICREAVMRMLPLIELLEREERWAGNSTAAGNLLQILKLVGATGMGAELVYWAQLQAALDCLDSTTARSDLDVWTPRGNEPLSMLRHAAGLRALGSASECELEILRAVGVLRRLASAPKHDLADASREAWAFAIYADLLEGNEPTLEPVIRARDRGVSLLEIVDELAERLDELEARRCDPRRELDRLARDFERERLRIALRDAEVSLPESVVKDSQWIVTDPGSSFLMLAEVTGLSLSTAKSGHVLGLLAARQFAGYMPDLALTLVLRVGQPSNLPFDGEVFRSVFVPQDVLTQTKNAHLIISHLRRLITATIPSIERMGEPIEMAFVVNKISLLIHILRGVVTNIENNNIFTEILDIACRAHDSPIVEATGAGWTELFTLFHTMAEVLLGSFGPSRPPAALPFLERLFEIAEPHANSDQDHIDPRASDDWPDPFRILAWEKKGGAESPSIAPLFELRDRGRLLVDLARASIHAQADYEHQSRGLRQRKAQLEASMPYAKERRYAVLSRRLAVVDALLKP